MAYVIWKFARDTHAGDSRRPRSMWSLPLIGSLPFLPDICLWHKEFLRMSARMGNVFAFYIGSQYVSCILLLNYLSVHLVQGSYGQGKSGNFEGVRESQGKRRGSGKSQGILKYCSLDQLFMHYFHNFCRLLGLCPRPPLGLRPCKHCRLVYIAIFHFFYNGTKFSITFVYLVLFYWCCE